MKKFMILGSLLILSLGLCSFSLDCESKFSIEASEVIDEYSANVESCNHTYSSIYNKCRLEANRRYYSQLDGILDLYEWCISSR